MKKKIIKDGITLINKTLTKYGLKELHPAVEKVLNSTSHIEPLNQGEEEWLKEQRERENNKDTEPKSDDEVRSIMQRQDYPNNPALKKQVSTYFKKKYPGPVKYG